MSNVVKMELMGYFVKPYTDSNCVEQVDVSCKDDPDVFPLYRPVTLVNTPTVTAVRFEEEC